MTREFLTSPDFKAPVLLNGSPGTTGQVPVSQGPGSPPEWGAWPAGGGASFAGYAANNWILPAVGTLANGTAMDTNSLRLQPFVVQRSITVSDLACRVVTAVASSSFQLAIYGSASGLPTGAPLGNTSSLSGAAASVVSSAVTPFNLTAGGLYWMATISDSAVGFVNMTGISTYFNSIIGAQDIAQLANASTSWTRNVNHPYGTLPDLTGVATSISTGNFGQATLRGAVIFLRVSALL